MQVDNVKLIWRSIAKRNINDDIETTPMEVKEERDRIVVGGIVIRGQIESEFALHLYCQQHITHSQITGSVGTTLLGPLLPTSSILAFVFLPQHYEISFV